ncbi:MAG: transporter [Candidatus Binatia bacterium]
MLAAVVLAVLRPLATPAGEIGRYAPSSWSPRDLISAPGGTAGFAPYFSYYIAGKARTGDGTVVDGSDGIDVGANSWMFTPVLFYAPSVKILGADWSITLAPAYGEAGANARLTAFGQDITLFDNNNTGWGDLYVIPANLTWHVNSLWALSAQYAFWVPVGEYDADRADNVGLGYWSYDFRGTLSYFPLGDPRLLLSASVLYEFNGRKEGFDLRPAPHTTAELGASMAFSERVMCGLIVGAIWESGGATGSDAAEDGRDRMFNVAAEGSYWFMPGKLGATGRVIQEFAVRDRFEGTTFTVGLNYLFGSRP